MGASALLKPIKKPVVDYVRKKIVEYSDDLMEPKVVDDMAAEVSNSIEKFAEKKQIPVEDKVKRASLYKYGAKILEREMWASPIARVKGDVDKLTDEDWSELNKRGNEHIKLRDQHDESEELDSEITAKLLQKHSDILQSFKFFKEEIDIEVDPDLDKFIDMQLSRHSGYNKLNLDKREHFRKLAQKTLREHPLTKDFRGEPPTITKAGTEEPDAAYQETEELVDSSSVKVPAYRGFASGGEYDWDQRYPFANEVGVHSGELGQAYSIILEKMSKELDKDKDYVISKAVERKVFEEEYKDDYYRDEQFDDVPKDYDEEVYYPIQEEGHILEEDIYELLDPESMSIAYRGGQPWSQPEIDWRTQMYHELRNPDTPMKPFQITKGWVRIRNPLVFAFDEPGNWNAADILQPSSDDDKYNFLLSNFLQAMAQTIGKNFGIDGSQLERLDKLQKKAKDLEDFKVLNLDDKWDEQPNVRYINELIHLFGTYNINKDFQRWLGSFGFDGIKYVNIKETPMAGSTDHLIDNAEVIRKYNPTGYQEEAIKHQGDRYWSYITFNPQQFKTVGKARYNIEDPRQNYVEGGRVRAASGWNWAKLFSFEKEPKMWIHEVKKGDTLSQIAKQFGKSVEEIKKINNIKDVNNIYVGDKFIIPKEETQKPKVKTRQTIRRPPQQSQQQKQSNIIVKEPVPVTDTSGLKNAIQSFFNSDQKENDEKKLVKDIQTIHSKEIQSKPANQPRHNLSNFLFGDQKLFTNKDYNPETIEGVRLAAMKVMNDPNRPKDLIDTVTYEDYQDGDKLRGLVSYQSKVGRDAGFLRKLLSKEGEMSGSVQAGTSIGGGSLIHDKDGNTYLYDVYDFNQKKRPESFDLSDDGVAYDWARWGLGKINKYVPDSLLNRFETRINLGPTENLKSGGGRSILVSKGDTLGTIANKYNTTVKNLLSVNDISDPDRIKVGDVLNIG